MKKDITSTVLEKVGSLAVSTIKLSANSTCTFLNHQAKMPQDIKNFKKK